MIELIDTADVANHYPLHSSVALQLQLSPDRQTECLATCLRMLATTPDLEHTAWYSEEWLRHIIATAPATFNEACNRWRELYAAAEQQLQDARAAIDGRYVHRDGKADIDDARRREREALRQKDLLCNTGTQGDTDFYPYRYLASEGFLPGYNFPRLPVRAFLPEKRDDGVFVARPRFLAITEFGPRNIIYHEGSKYRVVRTILPAGSVESRLVTAKLCYNCGFFHEGSTATTVDLCEQCGTRLDADTSLTTNRLFEMSTVATQRIEQITSDEEERLRQGYFLTSHYRFAPSGSGLRCTQALIMDQAGTPSLGLTYGAAASLWRINHRWRRSTTDGFTLDLKHGTWAKRPGDDEDTVIDPHADRYLSGVRIMVRDTRNVLLIQPGSTTDEAVLSSLQYALKRGIEVVFQIEEQELASERLGAGAWRRILLWEASEGGAGVLNRLTDEPDAIKRVARAALELCHFDPETGAERTEEAADCARACYRCLLSYTNQSDHPLLDRHSVRDRLLALATGTIEVASDPQASQVAAVEGLGGFAAEVLAYLRETGRRLPDAVRPELGDVSTVPDLFYADDAACVLCPDVPLDPRAYKQLADAGYMVIWLQPDSDLEAQLLRWPGVFGENRKQ